MKKKDLVDDIKKFGEKHDLDVFLMIINSNGSVLPPGRIDKIDKIVLESEICPIHQIVLIPKTKEEVPDGQKAVSDDPR
jgi:hypothetical protein